MKQKLRHLKVLWALITSALLGCGGDDTASSSVPLTQFSLPGGTTLEMVRIESGSFTMGSPDTEVGRASHEGPQKRVIYVDFGVYSLQSDCAITIATVCKMFPKRAIANFRCRGVCK